MGGGIKEDVEEGAGGPGIRGVGSGGGGMRVEDEICFDEEEAGADGIR